MNHDRYYREYLDELLRETLVEALQHLDHLTRLFQVIDKLEETLAETEPKVT